MQPSPETPSLEDALRILRRRVPLIVVCVVLVAGAAYLFSKHQTKEYTATASVTFTYNSLSQQIAGLQGPTGNILAQQASNLELVRLGNTATQAAAVVGHGLTPEQLRGRLKIAGQGESSIVDVSATDTSPQRAADIANTYVRLFVKGQQRTNRQYFTAALAVVNRELAKLSPKQRLGEDGLNLQNRAQTLRFLSELKYGNVQVAQEALPPTVPSSPNTKRNTELGVLVGLLIGLGLAFVLERLDSRIKGPDDLEEIYKAPLLGVAPLSSALARRGKHADGKGAVLSPAEAEAFNLIRAHLRFFNVDHDLRTIAIGSASPSDGKTTIARHLAEAAARLGGRVLLLEADLRQPTLTQQFGLPAGPGLADVLIGAISMEDATQKIELHTSPSPVSDRHILNVLAAGSMRPPNPGELMESRAMGEVVERARLSYDLVVIDTPPLTAVSDGLALLGRVDGLILVGWVEHSPRDAAVRLRRVLESSDAPVLGVIANGVKSSGVTPYPSSADTPSPAVSSASSHVSSPTGASVNGDPGAGALDPRIRT